MAEKDLKDTPVYHDPFGSGNGNEKGGVIDEAVNGGVNINNNVSAMWVLRYLHALQC